jgi:Flp pilus assembly protein TadB
VTARGALGSVSRRDAAARAAGEERGEARAQKMRGAMRGFASRYIALLWLLAVLSLVGWFIWNSDLAGWILVVLVVGLMVWQLTSRDRSRRGGGARSKSQRLPDEPTS